MIKDELKYKVGCLPVVFLSFFTDPKRVDSKLSNDVKTVEINERIEEEITMWM